MQANASKVVIWEEEEFLVAEKPIGLPSHPTRDPKRLDFTTLVERETSLFPLRTLHRLDRDTSGLMIFGKPPLTKERNRWLDHFLTQVQKDYLLVGSGTPDWQERELKHHLRERGKKMESVRAGGDFASTFVKVLKLSSALGHFLAWARIKTGRRHQIRVQMSLAGHPLWGDTLYGSPKTPPFFLHSCQISWEGRTISSLPKAHWSHLGYENDYPQIS